MLMTEVVWDLEEEVHLMGAGKETVGNPLCADALCASCLQELLGHQIFAILGNHITDSHS